MENYYKITHSFCDPTGGGAGGGGGGGGGSTQLLLLHTQPGAQATLVKFPHIFWQELPFPPPPYVFELSGQLKCSLVVIL